MGPGTPPQQRGEKEEGPAEEAPEDKDALRPVERVPAFPRRFRRTQLFELDGYFRFRTDYFHRLNLGLGLEGGTAWPNSGVTSTGATPPFFPPPAETPEVVDGNIVQNNAACINRLDARGVSATRANTRCDRRHGFASANLRLRLEPTFHITDTVSVHAQIDVLDNVVLGSTPDIYAYDSPWAPLNLFTRTQLPPAAGINSYTDSIVAKRAWAQLRFGWGLTVKAGRMPWQWGMGLVANDGNGYIRGAQDDIVRQVDQDYGDSLDALHLSFDLGRDRRRTYRLHLGWGWAASGPSTEQLLGPQWASGGTVGQAFSVERFDNVYQWSLGVERRDDPDMLQRKLTLGDPVVNFGVMAWLRYQDVDRPLGAPGLGSGLGTNELYYEDTDFPDPIYGGGAPLGNGQLDGDGVGAFNRFAGMLLRRSAFLATPDVWLRVNWRTLRVELEVAGTFGSFRLRDIDDDVEQLGGREYFATLDNDAGGSPLGRRLYLNGGYALEFKYGFFQDRFHIGFDHGLATGDETGPLGYDYLSPLPRGGGGDIISQFRFNPAYNIDLLLFREVLGTVANATYFKPWAAFYFFDHFSARADVEYAMALQRQATLGNRYSYGIELDGALRYHDAREPIFIQLQYGVLFPLGAFNRNNEVTGRREDARAVQTLQAQLGVKF